MTGSEAPAGRHQCSSAGCNRFRAPSGASSTQIERRRYARQRPGVRESSRALDSRTPLQDQTLLSFASLSQRERQRTAALLDRRSPSAGSLPPVPGEPPRSLGGYLDTRGSVLECASPLALSAREPHAGPNVSFFRIPFPTRAAEDCRTPGPADYSVSGFNMYRISTRKPSSDSLSGRPFWWQMSHV